MAAVLWLVFIATGRVLRRIAIARIAELTNTKIGAKSVDFNFDGSVIIEELVIRPPLVAGRAEPEYDDAILKAQRVYVRFGVGSLLLLRPRLKEININDFVFNAQLDLDTGRWNIAALKIRALKDGHREMPLIRLQRGTLQYSKVSNGQAEVTAAVSLDAGFEPTAKTQDGYSFNITTAGTTGFGRSTLTGYWQPGSITIAGGISSADIPVSERTWTINALDAELNYDKNDTYSMKLRIKDLLYTHSSTTDTFALDRQSFLEKFSSFAALQRFLNRFNPQGRVDIDLEASGNLSQLSESTLVGKVHCKDISICYHKFPYAIEHIIGRIDFTEKGVSLNNLSGEHGDVKLAINGWSSDFGPNCRYQIQITTDNMALDNDLYNALSTKQKRLWTAFSPKGLAAIDYRISRHSQTDKRKTLAVELLDVEAAYRHFPYPLKNLTGTLFFDRDSVTVSDVISQLNDRKLTINGKVTACRTDRPIYDISVKANNIPLDSTLAQALPDRQRHYYEQFDMAGLADAEVKIFTPKQDSGPTSFMADVSFRKTSLSVPVLQKDRKSRTPKTNQSLLVVSDVSGKAVFIPELIHIKNLTGRYGRGSIFLTGQIWPGRKAEQPRYNLSLKAEQVVLNDSLFSLLPAPLEKAIFELQPKGKVNIGADLNKAGSADHPDYKITVDCLGNSATFERFPYPLKDIRGRLTITKNADEIGVELRNITATTADNVRITPETSNIKIDGQIALADNSFSQGRFTLCANDIFFDERLGNALPENVQPFYARLSPTGRFDLDLENIKIFNADDREKYIDFTGTAKFKACNFNTSPPITELNAVLKTKGLYKTGEGFHDAQAAIIADSLRINGQSLTGLKADIDYDESRQSWLTKNLFADSYGGKVTGKFELKQPGAALEYLLQIGFDNIDLEQFLRDSERTDGRLAALSDAKPRETSRNGHTSGRMSGSLSVGKRFGDDNSRIGRCRLRITDMQVGELSPLAKLLNVLKLTEPKDFAFDRMLVDSYIKHNRLFFRQLDLSGEALAFNGSGWMDLRDNNIDLTLTARGRRLATDEPSILQSLTEGLGRAVVRMEVTGSVYDPQVETRTLPVIGDSLQILGTKPTEPD